MAKISGTIYLKGNEDLALELALKENASESFFGYSEEDIKKSVEEHAKARLRYNTRTGTIYIRNEWRERPTRKQDIQTYESIEEIVEWELLPSIMNGASRLSRKFKAIG